MQVYRYNLNFLIIFFSIKINLFYLFIWIYLIKKSKIKTKHNYIYFNSTENIFLLGQNTCQEVRHIYKICTYCFCNVYKIFCIKEYVINKNIKCGNPQVTFNGLFVPPTCKLLAFINEIIYMTSIQKEMIFVIKLYFCFQIHNCITLWVVVVILFTSCNVKCTSMVPLTRIILYLAFIICFYLF